MLLNFRMLTTLLAFSMGVLLCGPLSAQSMSDRFKQLDRDGDGKLNSSEAGKLGFFKASDSNRDGFVTLAEAEVFAKKSSAPPASSPNLSTTPNRNAGMEGDGAAPVFHWPVRPIEISESDSPVQSFEAQGVDGRDLRAWWRRPEGDGPFSTILFIHGGLKQFPDESLRLHLTDNPVITRFLSKGYN